MGSQKYRSPLKGWGIEEREQSDVSAYSRAKRRRNRGCTHQKKDNFVVKRPAPARYGLRIFDEERTQDRSQWGPIDRTQEDEEVPNPQFKFGSEAGGDTPDPDVVIPQSQEEENRIAAIAQLIPFHISKPPIQPCSLAGCNGHYNRTPDLGNMKCDRTWDLAKGSILDTRVLDR